MRMHTEDRMRYPWLAMFVVGELPRVVNKPRVWRAFEKFALADVPRWGKTASASILWGQGPTLAIEDIDDYYIAKGGVARVSGMFKHAHPNKIYLDDTLVAEYEADHQLSDAKRYIEATILHELVHWANHWTGQHSLLTVSRNGGLSVETHTPEGFEIEAYGKVLGHWR